jgi:anti-anti-sigma factor
MTNSDFKLTSEQIERQGKDPVTVFYLHGWLDAQCETQLFSAIEEVHTQGKRHLILQLEDVNILTSAGIRVIQKGYKLFASTDQAANLKLCSAPSQVYHALAVTGFLQTMPMYESLKSALTSYEE